MATDSTVEFRLAGPDDVAAVGPLLLDLGGASFPERFTGKTVSDFCRWKYFGNPSGNALVGAAVASGRIVSLVAATPNSPWWKERIFCKADSSAGYATFRRTWQPTRKCGGCDIVADHFRTRAAKER